MGSLRPGKKVGGLAFCEPLGRNMVLGLISLEHQIKLTPGWNDVLVNGAKLMAIKPLRQGTVMADVLVEKSYREGSQPN